MIAFLRQKGDPREQIRQQEHQRAETGLHVLVLLDADYIYHPHSSPLTHQICGPQGSRISSATTRECLEIILAFPLGLRSSPHFKPDPIPRSQSFLLRMGRTSGKISWSRRRQVARYRLMNFQSFHVVRLQGLLC